MARVSLIARAGVRSEQAAVDAREAAEALRPAEAYGRWNESTPGGEERLGIESVIAGLSGRRRNSTSPDHD